MKNILFLLLLTPALALANPFLGSCKTQYNEAYSLMIARQGGVPLPKMMEAVESIKVEDYSIAFGSELMLFYEAQEELVRLIERLYAIPDVSFSPEATHTVATDFANRQYLRCMRAKRTDGG